MTEIKFNRHIEPTQRTGMRFIQRGIEGSIVMLNLMHFREVADYIAHPELSPKDSLSGAEAFKRYIEHPLPFLCKSGGEVMFLGNAVSFLSDPKRKDGILS